jgi:5'(3')-deoxyribonucleotidase
MNKKIIAIDIDGVSGDLISEWIINRYNNDWNDSLKYEDIKDWGVHQFVKPECGLKIYDYLQDPSLYDNVLPISGAINGVFYLKTLGYRVIFVTHSTLGHAGRKFKWLLQHGFIEAEDDYCEAKDKSLILANYMIDDYIANVNSFKGQAILFTQPYNKRFLFTPRCDEWASVCRYFKNESNKEKR